MSRFILLNPPVPSPQLTPLEASGALQERTAHFAECAENCWPSPGIQVGSTSVQDSLSGEGFRIWDQKFEVSQTRLLVLCCNLLAGYGACGQPKS